MSFLVYLTRNGDCPIRLSRVPYSHRTIVVLVDHPQDRDQQRCTTAPTPGRRAAGHSLPDGVLPVTRVHIGSIAGR